MKFRPLPAIIFATALLYASDDGVINGGVASDAYFSSTALFIALLIFAGITVVEGSGVGFLRENLLDFINDVILSFAAENALPARFQTALIPLSRITSIAFIDNCFPLLGLFL